MTMLPADGSCVTGSPGSPSVSGLEKVLRGLSVFTMLMTVPQVLTIWLGRDAGGVSLDLSCPHRLGRARRRCRGWHHHLSLKPYAGGIN